MNKCPACDPENANKEAWGRCVISGDRDYYFYEGVPQHRRNPRVGRRYDWGYAYYGDIEYYDIGECRLCRGKGLIDDERLALYNKKKEEQEASTKKGNIGCFIFLAVVVISIIVAVIITSNT